MKRGYLKLNKKIVTKEELKNSQLMTIPDINYLYCDYCGSYNRAIKDLICDLRTGDSVYVTSIDDLGNNIKNIFAILMAFKYANIKFFINNKEFSLSKISKVIEDEKLIDGDGAIKSDEHAFKILNPILATLRHVDVSRNKEIYEI